jgi:hypothetical protein
VGLRFEGTPFGNIEGSDKDLFLDEAATFYATFYFFLDYLVYFRLCIY